MKAILKSGIYGFDSGSTPTKYIGTGLVDVKKAVNTPFGLTAFINPIPEAVHGKTDITGTAANDPKYTSFKKYRISIAQGEYPATDNVVFTDNNTVQNGKLITGFDTTQYLDGEYRLKMDVYNTDNTYITAYKIFTINNYGLVLDSKSPSDYKPGV